MRYLLVLFIFSCKAAAVHKENKDIDILIKNARIITGNGQILENASVAISGDRIFSINSTKTSVAKVEIDATGKTILPGLIDAHAHVFFSPRYPLQIKSEEEIADFIKKDLPVKLYEYLQIGVTTIFSPGDYWPYIRSVKEQLRNGSLAGPRLFIAGPILTAKGGHPSVTVCNGSQWCADHLAIELDEVKDVRTHIMGLASDVDAIKIVYDDGRRIKYNQLKEPVIAEVVRVSHEYGLPVFAHTPSDTRSAKILSMGADGLLHAPVQSLDSFDVIRESLIQHKIPVTTTLSVLAPFIAENGSRVTYFGSPYNEQMVERLNTSIKNLKDLIGSGVVIGFGTDTPMQPPRIGFYKEMEVLSKGGISNLQLIELMTKNAAIFLKKEDMLGVVEVTKLADLLVVSGNPVASIEELKNVWMVIKGGKIVVDKR